MSAPVRFLAVVAVGWVAIRAFTLGAVPGFTITFGKPAQASDLPPIAQTHFPPIPPLSNATVQAQQFAAFSPAWPQRTPPAIYYLPYARGPAAIMPREFAWCHSARSRSRSPPSAGNR